MVKKFKAWQTRTRNKIFAIGGTFAGALSLLVVIGWMLGKDDAPAMLLAIWGPTGVYGGLNSLAIAWEKGKLVK